MSACRAMSESQPVHRGEQKTVHAQKFMVIAMLLHRNSCCSTMHTSWCPIQHGIVLCCKAMRYDNI